MRNLQEQEQRSLSGSRAHLEEDLRAHKSSASSGKKNNKRNKKRKHSFDSILSLDCELDEFDTQTVRFKPESLDNLVKLTKFNRRELKLMYRGFKQLCPSGVVKEDKFKVIYAQFFPRGAETNGYARFIFNSFDVQRKQEITFTDFVIGLSVLTRSSIDERLKWIFNLYDINKDGVISRDEFSRIVCSIHDLMGKLALPTPSNLADASADTNRPALESNTNGQQMQANTGGLTEKTPIMMMSSTSRGEEQAESLFKKFDLNNDGVITLDEFLEACYKDDNIIKSISVFNTVL